MYELMRWCLWNHLFACTHFPGIVPLELIWAPFQWLYKTDPVNGMIFCFEIFMPFGETGFCAKHSTENDMAGTLVSKWEREKEKNACSKLIVSKCTYVGNESAEIKVSCYFFISEKWHSVNIGLSHSLLPHRQTGPYCTLWSIFFGNPSAGRFAQIIS